MTSLDMRVGMMKPAKEVSETLYLEMVDCGEAEGDRQILSKLVGRVKSDKMQGLCVVATNLKARKIGKDKSFGMILAGEDKDGKIGLLRPPQGSKPGDRVVVEDLSYDKYDPATANQYNKSTGRKIFASLMSSNGDFKTDKSGIATWRGRKLKVLGGGEVVADGKLSDANIH